MPLLQFGLNDKVVVVTGGAGGIGRSVCTAFAEAGAKVAVVDLKREAAEALAADLGSPHGAFGCDLIDITRHAALVGEIEDCLGPVDVLVNAAAVLHRTPDIRDITEREWDLQQGVNLKAVFFMIQAVAARMMHGGRGGSIVNYASQGGLTGGYVGSVVYSAAKGALLTMTRGLARSLAPNGIRVNAIAPGIIETSMLLGPDIGEKQLGELAAQIPMGRLGVPADCAGATVFLASDLASYITGATLNVSGGFLMY